MGQEASPGSLPQEAQQTPLQDQQVQQQVITMARRAAADHWGVAAGAIGFTDCSKGCDNTVPTHSSLERRLSMLRSSRLCSMVMRFQQSAKRQFGGRRAAGRQFAVCQRAQRGEARRAALAALGRLECR